MTPCLIVPFDASPVAHAALRRALKAARESGLYGRVLVATVGVPWPAITATLEDARARAGSAVTLEVCLLDAGDPIGSLHALIAAHPEVTVAVPVGVSGIAPWYDAACQVGGLDVAMMLFLLRPRDLEGLKDAGSVSAYRRIRVGALAALRAVIRHMRARLGAAARRAPGPDSHAGAGALPRSRHS